MKKLLIEEITRKFNFLNLAIFFSISFFIVGIYLLVAPRDMNLYYYYGILDKDSVTVEIDTIDVKKDLMVLDKCKVPTKTMSSEKCYLDFYQAYTIKNGPEMALSHLQTMMNKDSNIIPGCHYISHGIGEGAFVKNKKNIAASFNFDFYQYFKNIGSCGNGYFHGISIGLTRGAESDDELYNRLLDFCKVPGRDGGLGMDSCTHGIGHAVTIFYHHDRMKSIAMCDRLFSKDMDNVFGCYTGTMMEYGIYMDQLEILPPGVPGLLELCKDFDVDTPKREACIVEGSGIVRGIYSNDFIQAGKDCQALTNSTERKACTKLTVLHAVRIGRSNDAKSVCKVLENYSEKVECTSFFANYLSNAVDIKRGKDYYDALDDACHTLDILGYVICKAVNLERKNIFQSNQTLRLIPTWFDLKVVWNGKRVVYKDKQMYIP
jgi:hypothetical protein